MPRKDRSSTDAKHQLAASITAKREQLRRMEGRLREKQQRDLQAQYVRVGKLLDEYAMLGWTQGELREVLDLGLAALRQTRITSPDAPSIQDDEQ